jgi:hypothetical protein
MVAVVFDGSGDGQQRGGSKVTEAKRRMQQSNEDDVQWRQWAGAFGGCNNG